VRRRRKIRFIEPGSRPGRPFNNWVRRQPLLGPITLATLLDGCGYDAAVYNENVSGPLEGNEQAYGEVCSADVVGISIMTPTAARGYALADRIRRDAPETTIVFGGIHATFVSQEALEHGDIVVRGEAENVIEPVAAGTVCKGIIDSPPLQDLDSLPAPDYRLMRDFDQLLSQFPSKALYQLPVMASRGCPYRCSFCSVSRMFGQRVRRRSVDKVRQDLQSYAEQGFREFFFYDDNFTSNRDWTRELMHRIRPLGLRIWAQTRVDFPWLDRSQGVFDRTLLDAMRRGGASTLYIGYETIDDSTASQWHKGYRGDGALRERLLEDTAILHDSGFWIHGMFVVGPQHTDQTVDEIVEFSRQASLESIHLSILTPLPGTPLFEEMRPHLIFTDFPQDWDYYDGGHCVYEHSRVGVERLQEIVLSAHRRFYRGYGWSLRRIRDVLGQRAPLLDRLRWVRSTARVAQMTLKEWEEETRTFMALVRARRVAGSRAPRAALPGLAP
jgi:radical SAM superfamily enzyme YgiQ (UPF0313 family)